MAAATPEEKALWPPPNYDDPENQNGLVLGFTVPSFALAIMFLAVRFYGKGLLRLNPGPDDYLMLAAMIFGIPISVFPLVSLNLGLGLHVWDQKPEWHTPYSKLGYTADLLYPTTTSLTKLSLCLTYLRLFPNRTNKMFCYVIGGFVSLYTVTCVFLSLFQGYWDIDVEQRCINMHLTLVVVAALNSFSDFLVYLWPAKPLWTLQLPLKQRLGLIFLFSIGLLVCIAGVLRIYYLDVYFRSYDMLWIGAKIWSLMALEMNLGIICGCLSGVKPVMAIFLPSLFGSSQNSRSRATGQGYGHTGRSNRSESFAFQPLSDVSTKSHDKHNETAVSVDANNRQGDKEQSNFAWASSNGRNDIASSVPANAIGVQSVVTVQEEESRTVTPTEGHSKLNGLSDASSEEWIMRDERAPHGL